MNRLSRLLQFGRGLCLLLVAACQNGQVDDLRSELASTKQALAKSKAQLQHMQASYEETASTLAERDARLSTLPGTLEVQVAFELDGAELELDRGYPLGDGEISFGSLRYWFSNVSLHDTHGDRADIADSYYLMELHTVIDDPKAEEPTYSLEKRDTITLQNVPPGEYNQLSFNVGVDSEHNDDLSLPGGELNVLNNMATAQWMWFTSYIFTSLWATYQADPASDSPRIALYWEAGGDEALRRVAVQFDEPIQIGLDLQPKLRVGLNAARLFDDFSEKISHDAATSPAADQPASLIGPSDTESAQLSTNWQCAFHQLTSGAGDK